MDATLIVAFTFRILASTGLLLLLGVDWSATGTDFWRSLFLAIALGTAIGLLAAVPGYFAERGRDPSRLPEKVTEILTHGAGLLPPPPPDARARLLCAVLLPGRQFAGGIPLACASAPRGAAYAGSLYGASYKVGAPVPLTRDDLLRRIAELQATLDSQRTDPLQSHSEGLAISAPILRELNDLHEQLRRLDRQPPR